MTETRVLGLIPARGGSKGIPRKNLVQLGGKPLIAWSISAALAAEKIDVVVVSSEDEEILEISKSLGAEVLVRPPHLATDEASSDAVISHSLGALSSFDVIALLQPTSPLRTGQQIDEAISLLIANESEAVVSVTRARENAELLARVDSTGLLVPVLGTFRPERRQEFMPTFRVNGAIYAFKVKDFMQKASLAKLKQMAYLMTWGTSIDVESYEDLRECENAWKLREASG